MIQHIGIDARLTYYRTGGISTYVTHLVAALEGLDYANKYTIFHSRKACEVLPRRFRSARLWTPSHHRFERWALSTELVRHQLDVFHATDFIPPVFGARRMIATIHDLTFLHYPQFLTPESRRYYNGQIEYAVRRADHILTISEASKRDLIAMLDVPPRKITVHFLAADQAFKPLPDDETRAALKDLALPETYFLFVGTFEPRKNILGLVEAYRLLSDQFKDAPPLVIAGKPGWLFDETMAKINSFGLVNRVIFRENIPQAALPALYNRAVALILPSHYEGFGLPALEAMACGTVPIVSNRASLPEVVGDVGLLIDPDDSADIALAMRKILVDEAWRREMSERGLQRAAQFTWQKTAAIAQAVYETVI